jgi:GTP cyclohydrolase I
MRRAWAQQAAARAASAVARFLEALGIPPEVLSSSDVAATPQRVAEAWLDDLVDGYRRDPAEILRETMNRRGRDLVAVTGIDFNAVCPHHLLPYRGIAHVAYVPDGRVVGFGQIARLVDCFAHRLVIEEDLARQVAEALVTYLGARGAACVLDAEQLCLTVRGERRREARAHAQCFLGVLETNAGMQRRFLALVESPSDKGGRPASRSRSRSRSTSIVTPAHPKLRKLG